MQYESTWQRNCKVAENATKMAIHCYCCEARFVATAEDRLYPVSERQGGYRF